MGGWQRIGDDGVVVCVFGMSSSVVMVVLCGCDWVVVGCDGL